MWPKTKLGGLNLIAIFFPVYDIPLFVALSSVLCQTGDKSTLRICFGQWRNTVNKYSGEIQRRNAVEKYSGEYRWETVKICPLTNWG